MDKRMRKRMTMIKSEQNRAFEAQFRTISSMKSFDEIKDDRDAALEHDHDFSDDERDDTCDSSMMTDSISEMRRRRVYEMTHHRPYPTKCTKKKVNFWQLEEELHRPTVFLSPSFLAMDNRLSVPKSASSSNKMDRQESSHSSKKATARVLWKVETNNLQHDVEALVLDNTDERQRMKDNFIKDEIMDGLGYEDDEIMTPVRIKKFIDIYDDVKNDEMEREGFGQIDIVSPIVNEATVTEISEATQALAAFVTSAVGVMKEAKTPEKNGRSEHWTNLKNFEPSASKRNTAFEMLAHDQVCLGTDTPFHALKLFKDTAMAMAATPANKVITKIPTPMTTKTVDSSVAEEEIMVTKIGLDDNNVVGKVDYGVLWPSLFHDAEADVESSFGGALDPNKKAMLEALVEGGALQREIDGKSMLKLFVDMYHIDTFEKIISAIQELKGLQGLVICRALYKNRSTYRTNHEITSLFDATRRIRQLDSLILLNFNSDSLTNLAMMIHEQPSLYRLQIQLLDGTLNGEILGVMATAPRLTNVSLDLKESCSLGTLMNSKTLESVLVNSMDLELKKTHVRTLVYSLQTNFTLTTLDLGPSISLEHFRSLCITLRQNYRLESLRVNLDLKTEEESSIVALELANLFRENNFLLNVWNYSSQSCDISATNKRILLAALRSNKSIQEFKFFSEDIGDWKNTNGDNPFWLKRNVGTPATAATDTSTILEGTKDMDEYGSFFSSGSTVDSEYVSLRGNDYLMPFCGVDCSTLSPPFNCSTVKNMSANFQNWASTTTKNNQRTEI